MFDKANGKAYSNGQIQNMSAFVLAAKNKDDSLNGKDIMLKIIQSTPPEISASDMKKFEDEKKALMGA